MNIVLCVQLRTVLKFSARQIYSTKVEILLHVRGLLYSE